MINLRVMLLSAAAFSASIHPGKAKPCAADIEQLQARLDAHLDAAAASGPAGMESVGAKLHHQPTPAAIARAEDGLGEGPGLDAFAALRRARNLDRASDGAGCQQAIEKARGALPR